MPATIATRAAPLKRQPASAKPHLTFRITPPLPLSFKVWLPAAMEIEEIQGSLPVRSPLFQAKVLRQTKDNGSLPVRNPLFRAKALRQTNGKQPLLLINGSQPMRRPLSRAEATRQINSNIRSTQCLWPSSNYSSSNSHTYHQVRA